MKIGLYGINLGTCVDPVAARRVAETAERVGLSSLWTAEHVVLPDPQVPPSPVPAQTPLLDPAVALAHVAAVTERVRLGTGIIILPQRNPVVLAKELASVDVLSGGRLLFGLGAGYLHQEFAAVGTPFSGRGARTDEYIDAIVALWTQEHPEYHGEHVAFSGIDAQPRPIQKPHPPIVVGGQSPGAYRRAVARGNAWYGFALDLDATARSLAGLEAASVQTERPASLGKLWIHVTPPPGVDAAGVRAYAALGVDELVLLPPMADADGIVAFLENEVAALLDAA